MHCQPTVSRLLVAGLLAANEEAAANVLYAEVVLSQSAVSSRNIPRLTSTPGPSNTSLAAVVLTRDVAEWLADLCMDAIPASVVERASAGILDTVGVTLAGLDEPAAQIAARLAASDGPARVASQLGTPFATSMESAAFVNGVAGHALDYDDVSYAVIGHPSVVVLPAALAVGQATGASGSSVLTAYIGGIEVMAKLARAMGEQRTAPLSASSGCSQRTASALSSMHLFQTSITTEAE